MYIIWYMYQVSTSSFHAEHSFPVFFAMFFCILDGSWLTTKVDRNEVLRRVPLWFAHRSWSHGGRVPCSQIRGRFAGACEDRFEGRFKACWFHMGFMMFHVYKIESTDINNSIFQTWLGLLFQIESFKMMRSIAKLKVAWGDPGRRKSRHAGETEESSTCKQ